MQKSNSYTVNVLVHCQNPAEVLHWLVDSLVTVSQ